MRAGYHSGAERRQRRRVGTLVQRETRRPRCRVGQPDPFQSDTSDHPFWTWRSAVQGLRPYAPDGRYPMKGYVIRGAPALERVVGRVTGSTGVRKTSTVARSRASASFFSRSRCSIAASARCTSKSYPTPPPPPPVPPSPPPPPAPPPPSTLPSPAPHSGWSSGKH
jgi:hypothetical protein